MCQALHYTNSSTGYSRKISIPHVQHVPDIKQAKQAVDCCFLQKLRDLAKLKCCLYGLNGCW